LYQLKSSQEKSSSSPHQLIIESFCPPTRSLGLGNKMMVSISVQSRAPPMTSTRHDAIMVCGMPCAMGAPHSLSVVVIDNDEIFLGSILQSRSVSTLRELAQLIVEIPPFRIVAIHGKLLQPSLENGNNDEDDENNGSILATLSQLGSFDHSLCKDGVIYVGQVLARPDWAYCSSFNDSPGYTITAKAVSKSSREDYRLQRIRNARPQAVMSRIAESIMPLQTQLLATDEQKHAAFVSLLDDKDLKAFSSVAGYTTKAGCPIYLLGGSSYPIERIDGDHDKSSSWSTVLVLPSPLVSSSHVQQQKEPNLRENIASEIPQFEVPLDINFFVQRVGAELLTQPQAKPVKTPVALHNACLIGLYFSAHWCGRKFSSGICFISFCGC
jgi:hypothetical protein